MTHWQPIETAPRDVRFLTWHPHGAYRIAMLFDGVHAPAGTVVDPVAGRTWKARWWQPLPPPPEKPGGEESAFLDRMERAARDGEPVTIADVSRLRRLADWADTAPPEAWGGTLDRGEGLRAVEAARTRISARERV